MPEYVPFASNYIDRSTSYAFQFEFFCWRCGSGYKSNQEIASSAGASAGGFAASKALGFIPVVGDLLGDKASDAIGDKAKEGALQRAIAQVPRWRPSSGSARSAPAGAVAPTVGTRRPGAASTAPPTSSPPTTRNPRVIRSLRPPVSHSPHQPCRPLPGRCRGTEAGRRHQRWGHHRPLSRE